MSNSGILSLKADKDLIDHFNELCEQLDLKKSSVARDLLQTHIIPVTCPGGILSFAPVSGVVVGWCCTAFKYTTTRL
jgi:hypothetical protein